MLAAVEALERAQQNEARRLRWRAERERTTERRRVARSRCSSLIGSSGLQRLPPIVLRPPELEFLGRRSEHAGQVVVVVSAPTHAGRPYPSG
jgi:hypothetical protein